MTYSFDFSSVIYSPLVDVDVEVLVVVVEDVAVVLGVVVGVVS